MDHYYRGLLTVASDSLHHSGSGNDVFESLCASCILLCRSRAGPSYVQFLRSWGSFVVDGLVACVDDRMTGDLRNGVYEVIEGERRVLVHHPHHC